MKSSEIYRRAAEIVSMRGAGRFTGTRHALLLSGGGDREFMVFNKTFDIAVWEFGLESCFWGWSYGGESTGNEFRDIHNCRVLMLLFMSEIAKDME